MNKTKTLPPTAPPKDEVRAKLHLTPSALWDQLPTLPMLDMKDYLSQGERGDADLLAFLYQDRIAYDHSEKQWYLWTGEYWEADTKGKVYRLVSEFVRAEYVHAAGRSLRQSKPTQDSQDAAKAQSDAFFKRAKALCSRTRIESVLTLATKGTELALSGQEWDKDPYLLVVRNGTINLESGKLQPGMPGDYVRTVANANWEGDAECPRWIQFLDEIFGGNQELVDFMQRLFGYAITGLSTEHVLAVFHGEGRNGKDTMLEALSSVLNGWAGPVSTDILINTGGSTGAATPHLMGLRGKRLAWCSETNEGQRLDAAQVKLITGGGAIPCRGLYQKATSFVPHHLLCLITNSKPHADARDYALWKRMLLIPFTQSFVREIEDPDNLDEHLADKYLREELVEESDGILQWLVEGTKEYLTKGLMEPDSIIAATTEYRSEEDTLSLFVDEICRIGSEYTIAASALYQQYKTWLELNSLGRPMSSTAFGRRMGKQFERGRKSSGKFYYGVTTGTLAEYAKMDAIFKKKNV